MEGKMKSIKKIDKNNPDYLYRLLLAEQHENQLLRAKIQNLIIQNEGYAFEQKIRFWISTIRKNRFILFLISFVIFIFLLFSEIIALIIFYNYFG